MEQTPIQSLDLPTFANGNNARFTLGGSTVSEGALALSQDGQFLTLGGYDASPGLASVSGTASSSTNRVVARVDAYGNIDTTTRLADAYNSGSIRSAFTTNGTAIWTGGNGSIASSAGVRYSTLGSTTSTQISSSPTNVRVVNTFNNQLYLTSGSSSYVGINLVGTNLPATPNQTTTLLPGFLDTGSPSPYGFAMFTVNHSGPILDVAYIADDRASASGGGIQYWKLDGSTWVYMYTLKSGLTTGIRDLTAVSNDGIVTLYATTTESSGNRLVKVTDNNSSSTFETLAIAPENTVFRGVAFAPTAKPDLKVDITGPSSAKQNTDFTYTLTASNIGTGKATNVKVQFTFPYQLTYSSSSASPGFIPDHSGSVVTFSGGTINGGDVATLSVTVFGANDGKYTVLPGAAEIDPYSTIAELDETNNTSTTTITTLVSDKPDLRVSLNGPATATAGQSFNYVLTVANGGAGNATGVEAQFTLPADVTYQSSTGSSSFDNGSNSNGVITFTGGSLPANSSTPLTVTVSASSLLTINAPAGAAKVNPEKTVPESIEDNNSSVEAVTTVVGPPACSGAFTPTYTLQGSGATSPAVDTVVTVQGVVVGDYEGSGPNLGGFYIQDETGDSDPTTSDGLFIYNSPGLSVTVGQVVRVTGTVKEIQGQTEISTLTSFESCGRTANITPVDVTLPLPDASYLERFEGMLVRFPQTLYVTEMFQLGRFGQVVMSSGGRLPQPTSVATPGPAAKAQQDANDLNRIIVDDALNNQNPDPILFGRSGAELTASNTLRGGDSATGMVGVLTYNWAGNVASPNAYRLRPVNALNGGVPNFQATNPRPSGPPVVGGRLKVASFNVFNYFLTLDLGASSLICGPTGNKQQCRGAENATELDRQQQKLNAALLKLDADVVGIMELENTQDVNPLADIVTRLNTSLGGGDIYGYINTGVIGSDTIRVGIIYKKAKVTPVGAALFDLNPVNNRPPVAQLFSENATGEKFTVIVNHLKSKGSCPNSGADADQGDGQGCWNQTRVQQAQRLLTFINGTVLPTTGDPDVLLLGDFNSYAKEDPIKTLETAGYTNLVAKFGGTEAYSYAFDGQWGYLDQGLASASLVAQVSGANDYHINADEPGVLDYNTNYKSTNQQTILYNSDEFRTSDHDPVVTGLNLYSYIVTKSEDDDLPGSLRYAITTAQSDIVDVTITFTPTLTVVNVSAQLPDVTNSKGKTITINGGKTAGGEPLVQIDGNHNIALGLKVIDKVVLTGLKITNFGGWGLVLNGSNNLVTRCWIGTADGLTSAANTAGGILIQGGNNTLGDIGAGNIISGNGGPGLRIEGKPNNILRNNLIGYQKGGTQPLPNTGSAIQLVAGGQLMFKSGGISKFSVRPLPV